MTELEIPTSDKAALSARAKRDAQRAQLRPLANLRPELVDDEGYSPDELEAMMEMYNGTMASIDEKSFEKVIAAVAATDHFGLSLNGVRETFQCR